jgi:ribonuclease D
MYEYTLIDTDEAFIALIEQLQSSEATTVAMDFEGEFNLHVYGEHLCLIQLYDGNHFFLVDPLAVSIEPLKAFLEDPSIEKVMFDCASDSALVRKQHSIQMEGVYDLRVHALALGHTGNLNSLITRYLPDRTRPTVGSKRRNQQTNWMLRPLKAAQIQYALDDVAHLLDLRPFLEQEIAANALTEQVEEQMKRVGRSRGPERPPWSKFSAWKYLSHAQKTFVKHFFLARDRLAQKYNVPAVRIMEKQHILRMAKEVPASDEEFSAYCNHRDPRRCDELLRALKRAKQDALTELDRS